MSESYSIEAILSANVSGFVNGIKQAKSQMDTFVSNNQKTFDSFKQVGTAATAGGVAIAAGLGGAVKIAANFQEGMSKVQAISGATGDDMVLLSAKAREMGSKTKFSATQASEAFSYMAMAGWKTTDMLDGIAPVMNLAAASGEDLALTADILTDGLTAFGLKAKDGGRFADVMAAASSNANTNVAMLGESFKYVAPLAGAMGYSVEDTSLALGLMANAGVKGSQAGTSLKTMFTNLAKPTKAMKGAMDDLGISLTNSDGSMKSMEEVISDLRTGFGGLDEAQQANYAATIFGKEAMAGALAVINASEEDYNKLKGAIDNSKGAAEEMARVMQDNLNGSLTNLKSALEEVAISIGMALIPYIEKAVAFVQMLADKFNGLDEKTQTIIAVIAALAAGFLLLVGPILLLIGFIPSMLAGWAALSTVIGTVSTALGFLAGPIGIAIAAIALIGAALVIAYNKVEWFRDAVDAAWSALKDVAVTAFTTVKEAVMEAMSAVADFLREKLDQILAFWNENGAQISQAAQNIWSGIQAIISAIMPVITAVIQGAWFLVQALVKAVWENIKGVIDGALNVILGLVKTFASLFTGDWQGMWEGVKQLFSGAIELIWNAVQLMLWGRMLKGIAVFAGSFKGAAASMWGSIKSVFSSSVEFVKGLFTKGFQSMQTAGSTIMNAIKTVISNVWNAIKTVFSTAVELVKSVFTKGFEAIKSVANTVMNAIKTVISTVWNAIKTVFSGSVNAVKDLVTSGFNLIKSTITTIMNAIKSLITTVWNAIKSVITSSVNAVKNAVTAGFNAIRSVVTSVMNAIRSLITSAWNAIKSVVSSVMNAIKSVIQAGWNGVKSTITSAMSAITNAIKSGFNAVVNAIRSAMTTAVSTVKSMMTSMVSAVTGAAGKFLQAGKDLIQGLISGIMSMAGAAVNAITGVVDGVVKKAKSLLGIKSPSRVFMGIGDDTMQGWINGMSKREDDLDTKMRDLSLLMVDIAEHYKNEEIRVTKSANNEISKIEKRAKEDVAKIRRAAADKKRKTTKDENIKIQRIQENAAKKAADIEKKATADSVKLLEEEQKAKLKEIKLFIDDKKSLEQLNFIEEAALWEMSVAQFADSTKEKVKAQKAYKAAVEEVNKEILAINQEYTDKMMKINDDLKKQEDELTSAYEKTLEDRTKSLRDFAGIFDFFDGKVTKTSEELMWNLQSQVLAFERWQQEIDEISNKAIDKGLIEELKAMGPKALPELIMLNAMTERQLDEYSDLYATKSRLAREQAEKELSGMRDDTKSQIEKLRETADRELNKLHFQWQLKMKNIAKTTDNELSSLRQIGVNASRGLLDGMASMEPALRAKAKSIAQSISSTMKEALKVKSPSRVMMEIGRFVGEGLADGISGMYREVEKAAAGLADAATIEPLNHNLYADQLATAHRQSESRMQSEFTNELHVNKQPAVINVRIGNSEFNRLVDDITQEQSTNKRLTKRQNGRW